MPRKGTCAVSAMSLPGSSGDFWKVWQLEHKIPVLRCYAAALVPPSAAAATYYAMLSLSQMAGMALGVSCATPVLGPALGTLAVASASVAAAQVSLTVRQLCGGRHHKKSQVFLPRRDVLFYAVFGVVAFKVLGGSCRNLLPSDVVHPGALARASVPAKGAKYAGSGSAESQVVQDLYKRDGCHHCGKRGGEAIADHMPPNVHIHGRGWSKTFANGDSKGVLTSRVKPSLMTENLISWLWHGTQDAKQRYFPQCVDCMKLQSVSLRHGKRSLVLHLKRAFPEPPYLAGFCVGALHLDDWDSEVCNNGMKKAPQK